MYIDQLERSILKAKVVVTAKTSLVVGIANYTMAKITQYKCIKQVHII